MFAGRKKTHKWVDDVIYVETCMCSSSAIGRRGLADDVFFFRITPERLRLTTSINIIVRDVINTDLKARYTVYVYK